MTAWSARNCGRTAPGCGTINRWGTLIYLLPLFTRGEGGVLKGPTRLSGCHELLAVDALLLWRARIELPVAFGEVRGRDEAAGNRHFHHRHRRLDQQMPGPVQPYVKVVAGRGAAQFRTEQSLDLTARKADFIRDLNQRQRLREVGLH